MPTPSTVVSLFITFFWDVMSSENNRYRMRRNIPYLMESDHVAIKQIFMIWRQNISSRSKNSCHDTEYGITQGSLMLKCWLWWCNDSLSHLSEFVTITKDNHQERKEKETERRKKANAVCIFYERRLGDGGHFASKTWNFSIGSNH